MSSVLIVLAIECLLVSGVVSVSPSWIMNDPSSAWPTMKKVSLDDVNQLELFSTTIKNELKLVDGSSDGEAVDAFEHYFWHMEGGVVIELGALDGSRETNSQSLVFEKFGWKRILIEANPLHRNGLQKQMASFAVSAAICSDEKTLHYSLPTDPKNHMTGGIVEFMQPNFVHQYHMEIFKCYSVGGIFNISKVDWKCPEQKALTIIPVTCLPIARVLDHAHVTHINFFILDVEGAEISILSGIDFTRFTFDIIVIEKTHWKQLRHFFSQSDYELVAERGRNYWFKNKNFKPHGRPEVATTCFRGCVKAGIVGSKKGFCTQTSLPIN
jgi:hypothetical protein